MTTPNDADKELRRRIIEYVSGVQTNTISHIHATDGIFGLLEADRKRTRQAVLDEVLAAIDGVEIDIEATFKHLEGLGLTEDEEASQKLSANIDYDDRHDTLNDVRQAVNGLKEKK